ncbi:PRC-barrel domain-containing protein [Azospirillum rugosum]|uniref:Sporulation protein YlmC with PRC-barrel domain n=1 Tax=Azospirillum rugosum TaxID=416170 RepID=A0ABS4SEB4_9PROT|nr:PRC-barrel domain-containing protein [Azospirillum rugosum]MBP2290910.1 sporulation protein YlmC with PRC-barrel domain [Azospirillum rugosum]MDQ0525026.1 sporulation protein YlmC with PRC-barrel domain [Azospirillum rugosum]
MRREIFAAASVLALMTGAAFAQSSTSPGTGNPAAGGPTATEMNQTGQSQADKTQADMNKSGLTGGQLASAEHLLGKNVYGKDNEKVGEVEDIILDTNGQAKQIVISSGGFLGIGEKQIAVEYSQANWDQNQDRVQLSGMSRDEVKNMPEFQYSDTTTSLNRNKDKAGGTTNDAASRSSTGTTGNTMAPSGTTAPSGAGSPSGSSSSGQ